MQTLGITDIVHPSSAHSSVSRKVESGVSSWARELVAEVADVLRLALRLALQGRRSVAKLPLGESKGLRHVAEWVEAEKRRHTFPDRICIHCDWNIEYIFWTSNLGSKMVFKVSLPAMLGSCRRRWRLGLHSRSETCISVTESGKASCSTRQSLQHEQLWAILQYPWTGNLESIESRKFIGFQKTLDRYWIDRIVHHGMKKLKFLCQKSRQDLSDSGAP